VLNALTDDMVAALREAFHRADDDADAQVAVLSGNGRAFCSGADVRQRQLRPREELERLGGTQPRGAFIEDVLGRFQRWKPIIVAAHGYVLGAALHIALRADLIVAAEGTRFQVTEVSRGVDARHFWHLLAQRTGGGFATDVALTGRFWTAEEGVISGAVDRLAPVGTHLSVAEALAREIVGNPPLAVRSIVKARRVVSDEIQLLAGATKRDELQLSEDFRESARAFVEKREPRFVGR
jgi:enoyl-CoA hydratase/carnithine racemase